MRIRPDASKLIMRRIRRYLDPAAVAALSAGRLKPMPTSLSAQPVTYRLKMSWSYFHRGFALPAHGSRLCTAIHAPIMCCSAMVVRV